MRMLFNNFSVASVLSVQGGVPSETASFRQMRSQILKGLRPLPPTPADSRIFGFWDFVENVVFSNFPVGFRVWEGLQSIGNGCGLQMYGFSAHFEPSESISVDFYDLGHFAIVSVGLTLFPEGPRTLQQCPKGPRTL